MLKCHYCDYTSNRSFNMRRHEKSKHFHKHFRLSSPMTNKNKQFESGYNDVGNINQVFDIRLK